MHVYATYQVYQPIKPSALVLTRCFTIYMFPRFIQINFAILFCKSIIFNTKQTQDNFNIKWISHLHDGIPTFPCIYGLTFFCSYQHQYIYVFFVRFRICQPLKPILLKYLCSYTRIIKSDTITNCQMWKVIYTIPWNRKYILFAWNAITILVWHLEFWPYTFSCNAFHSNVQLSHTTQAHINVFKNKYWKEENEQTNWTKKNIIVCMTMCTFMVVHVNKFMWQSLYIYSTLSNALSKCMCAMHYGTKKKSHTITV